MTKKKTSNNNVVTAYKAFSADWSCRDFKYEIGKTYSIEGEIELCSRGFHACLIPFDCWSYYEGSTSLARVTVFDPKGYNSGVGDSKIVTTKISIDVSLSLPKWIKAQVETVLDICKTARGHLVSKNQECAAATGYRGHAAATGDSGHAAATGYSGHAAATGENSIAASLGLFGIVEGANGTSLVLQHHEHQSPYNHICVKTVRVGENGIKPNTPYRLSKDGEFEVAK